MQPVIDSLKGELVISDLPDLACDSINSFSDLLKVLPRYLIPIFPSNQSNLVVGVSEPLNSEVTKLWERYDSAGNVVGLYGFTAGKWYPIVQPIADNWIEIKWLVGDSANPPPGWTLVDNTGPTAIPAGVRTYLQTLYNGADPQSYKAYMFTGYV